MVSLFVLGALVLEVEAIQDPQTQGHDYSLISTRNAFNLSNEPPPRKESAPPPEPPEFFHVIESYFKWQSVNTQSEFQFASSCADAGRVDQPDPACDPAGS